MEGTEKIIEIVKNHSICKDYPAGKIILEAEAPIGSIPFVLEGILNVFRVDSSGKEILLYHLEAGESCIMSFLAGLHQQKSSLKVQVETAAKILFFPLQKIHLLQSENFDFWNYIFQLYHKRFDELLNTISAISFEKMDTRLLAFLKKKSDLEQKKILDITHEQIAQALGTSRVVISRLLKTLEEKKILHLSRNKIELL